VFVGELAVDGSVDVRSSRNIGLVSGIEEDLHESLSVGLHSGALSGDFGGVDNIVQDGILNGGQCSRARTRSAGLLVASISLSENCALSNDHDDLSGEFLFELTDKFLVNLVDRFEQLERNIQDDSSASASTVDLLCGCDVNASKRGFELGRGHFKVKKLIGNLLLESVGFLWVHAKQRQEVRIGVHSNHFEQRLFHRRATIFR